MPPPIPDPDPEDRSLWSIGVPGDPQVGDLWTISWDGADLGVVLLAALRPSHVVAWPVTGAHQNESSPCFHVTANWLNTELVAWPEAEAGMSKALLNRRLGQAVSDRTMLAVHVAIREAEAPDGVLLAETRDDEEAESALDFMCRFASSLSDVEWTTPASGAGLLNRGWADSHGVTPSVLAEVVGGPVGLIRDIAAGRRLLPADAATELANRHRASWADVVTSIAGDEAAALDQPSRKAQVIEIASSRRMDEATARREVWQHSMRAARQQGASGAERAASRVDQALDDLLHDVE